MQVHLVGNHPFFLAIFFSSFPTRFFGGRKIQQDPKNLGMESASHVREVDGLSNYPGSWHLLRLLPGLRTWGFDWENRGDPAGPSRHRGLSRSP